MPIIRKAQKEDAGILEKLYTELEEDAVLYQPEHFVLSNKGERAGQLEGILQSESHGSYIVHDRRIGDLLVAYLNHARKGE